MRMLLGAKNSYSAVSMSSSFYLRGGPLLNSFSTTMRSSTSLVLCIVFTFCLWSVVDAAASQQLTVHIIPHTHDDVGWKKTVDQYYYGANNTIQDARVQYILDTAVQCLLENPNRKFIYVEIAFFMRWWREQTGSMQQVVRQLVSNGQLEFISGGWCMNDEASVHYEATIDQLTEGHSFLLQEFGIRPKTGWQIDPFGHASGYVNLIAQMGLEAVFYARIDYQDYAARSASKSLEYIWRPTASFGSQTQIFAHAFYDRSYGSPSPIWFQGSDQPIMDDPTLEDYNLDSVASAFAEEMQERAQAFATNQILIPWGHDFAFSDAFINFKNMDKLMDYVNSNSAKYHMKLIYSTPSIYLAAMQAVNRTDWPLKTDDHFPYGDAPHDYWSGYFTSRQALKGYERSTSAKLHAAQKLLSTALLSLPENALNASSAVSMLDQFAQSHAIVQHHDGVSGTEQQHVADDYALRLYLGELDGDAVMAQAIGKLISSDSSAQLPPLSTCPLLNVSQCPATESLVDGDYLPVIVYNSLSFTRTEVVRLVVPSSLTDVVVYNSSMAPVQSQLDPNIDSDDLLTLTFVATVPALGFETYLVYANASSEKSSRVTRVTTLSSSDVTITGSYLSATVSGTTGRLSLVRNHATGVSLPVDQVMLWYNASAGNNDLSSQASGAYIFRPNSSSPFSVAQNNVPVTTKVLQGSLVQEIRQTWSSWLSQVIRIYSESQSLEIEFTIQPIPIDDGLGKELIARFDTPLATKSTWYTDTLGQEMLQRVRNYRATWKLDYTSEPVACNYFPMNTATYQQNSSVRMTLLTDRSRGVGSLSDGSIEVMVQRRLLYDDRRGVDEPLNETVPVRSRLLLQVNPVDSAGTASAHQRIGTLALNNPFQVFFGTPSQDSSWLNSSSYAPLIDLPPGVQLITLRTLSDGQVLLRLSHVFAANDGTQNAQPITVNLATIFSNRNIKISSIVETQLSANIPLSQMTRLRWGTAPDPLAPPSVAFDPHPINSVNDDLNVVLHPLQIRTFIVSFQSSWE